MTALLLRPVLAPQGCPGRGGECPLCVECRTIQPRRPYHHVRRRPTTNESTAVGRVGAPLGRPIASGPCRRLALAAHARDSEAAAKQASQRTQSFAECTQSFAEKEKMRSAPGDSTRWLQSPARSAKNLLRETLCALCETLCPLACLLCCCTPRPMRLTPCGHRGHHQN
jgi:hypothetical protein